MKAAIYDQPGAPDVLRYADVPDPVCPPDGVIIVIEAIAPSGTIAARVRRVREAGGP